MFIFDLSVALQTPVQEIREWSVQEIDEYRAYHHLRPFTKRIDHELNGFVIELLRNQHVTKQSQYKRAEELIPFLSGKLPAALDDPRIIQVRNVMAGKFIGEYALNDIKSKLLAELQYQSNEETKDEYYINEIIKLFHQCNVRLEKLQEQKELAALKEQEKSDEQNNNNKKEDE